MPQHSIEWTDFKKYISSFNDRFVYHGSVVKEIGICRLFGKKGCFDSSGLTVS